MFARKDEATRRKILENRGDGISRKQRWFHWRWSCRKLLRQCALHTVAYCDWGQSLSPATDAAVIFQLYFLRFQSHAGKLVM